MLVTFAEAEDSLHGAQPLYRLLEHCLPCLALAWNRRERLPSVMFATFIAPSLSFAVGLTALALQTS
jgi:hypothetical protein